MNRATGSGVAMFGMMAAAALGAGAEAITLVPRAEVAGPFVRLTDVVATQGLSAARAEAWRDVYLGPTPPPGGSRTIGREAIRVELRKRGAAADALDWDGPSEVVVTGRAGAALDGLGEGFAEDLNRGIRDLLLRELPAGPTGTDLEVRILRMEWVGDASPAAGPCRLVRVEPHGGSSGSRVRRFLATLGPESGAGTPRACAVDAHLQVIQHGVRARRTIPAGAAIHPADIELGAAAVDEIVHGIVTALEALAGCRARGRIDKGMFLRDTQVQGPPVVRPHDAVMVTARDAAGRMSLTYAAEALEAGAVGDAIRVRLVASKRVGIAKVVGPGAAEVELSGPEAPPSSDARKP